MSQKKDTSIVRLAVVLALFTASGSLGALAPKPALARSPISLPVSVTAGAPVPMDGLRSMATLVVDNATAVTPLAGSVGLVAIERPLLAVAKTADHTTGVADTKTVIKSGVSPWWFLLLLGIPLLWWFLKDRRQDDASTMPSENPIATGNAPSAKETAPVTEATIPVGGSTVDPDLTDLPTAIEPPLEQGDELEIEATPPLEMPSTAESLETPPITASPESTSIPETTVLAGSAALVSDETAVTGTVDYGDVSARTEITLSLHDHKQAEAVWEAPDAHKAELRRQGGQSLKLRLYDVTNVDLAEKRPQSFQEFAVAEDASNYTMTIQPDREYLAEIGYLTGDRYWLLLARSHSIRVPSLSPPESVDNALGAGAATLAVLSGEVQSAVEATKYNVGQSDLSTEALASVDEGLPDLPEGYGESRIVLMPRDPQWGYAYWDAPNEAKEELRRQGGQRLALRLYDVTDVDLTHQSSHSLQQYDCDELARDWYVPIPVSDRDYIAEIGYLTDDGRWLLLARSNAVRIPPVYPSEWFEDYFISVGWTDELRGKAPVDFVPPEKRTTATANSSLYEQVFGMAQSTEALRVAGSLFGSMQHVTGSGQQIPSAAISSYIFPSGIGMGRVPGVPGAVNMPGVPNMSGLTMSGIGMSGIGMSGIGFGASLPPLRARKFWLVADAELIVYGATEPDATVTIDGRPIHLNPDGTFRFQMSFQDGVLNFPIIAIAADGEQSRSIHMTFNRETPHRNTNTKDEAVDELF